MNNDEKIIQIIDTGEFGDKITALTNEGRIFYQDSPYRGTSYRWYELDLPDFKNK